MHGGRDRHQIPGSSIVARYLISFPSAAMAVPAGHLEAVGRDDHARVFEFDPRS
jgi:hypothetical protein